MPSRNRGSAWDKGRLAFLLLPPFPLFLSSLFVSLSLFLSVFEGEESGATRHESCKLGGEKGRFFGLVKSLKSVRGRAG